MNILVDRLPDTVIIGGTEYAINTDFRASILFELLIQDDTISDYEKIVQTLALYFPDPPNEDIRDIFQAIIWFYQCGRSDKDRKLAAMNEESGADDSGTATRAYSFEYDDEYIYAAFRQQYGINLSRIENLHWWEFRAMFKGLDHDCEFVKIMGYRAAKITSDMSKTEKKFLRRMKSIHALPISEKEQEETDILINALMNGGDLTGILDDSGKASNEKEENAGSMS